MRQWQTKTDNAAPAPSGELTAAEDNARGNELSNLVSSAGITPDLYNVTSDTDLFMVAQATARYASGGVFYQDSGAANAYVLSTPGAFIMPKALFRGMQALWIPGHTNSGASTANVAALGNKPILRHDGSALAVGDIVANRPCEMFYDPSVGSGTWLLKPWTLTQGSYALDTGTANAMVVTLTPAPSAYVQGLYFFAKKSAAANTGNVTVNVNGLGAVSVLDVTGAQIPSGNLPANVIMFLLYDGAAMRLLNGSITATTVGSLTGSSGEGVNVQGVSPYAISLNFAGLSTDTPTALDLHAFYDNETGHHHVISHANLLVSLAGSLNLGLVNMQTIAATGTYTKTSGVKRALVMAVGGGGGGGGANGGVGSGGGAGETIIGLVDLTGVSSVAVTIGGRGAGGVGVTGSDALDTTFGAYITAKGGKGGFGTSSGEQRGGLGGTGGSGGFSIPGNPGDALTINGGSGGSSFLGAGGRAGAASGPLSPGGDAPGYGGGGGGADYSGIATGGNGGTGCVLIFEFA